jgi:hypothetical protein
MKKTLLVATITAAAIAVGFSGRAAAGHDYVAGALVGGGIGAAVGGPPGAAIGAILGLAITDSHHSHYYDRRHQGRHYDRYRERDHVRHDGPRYRDYRDSDRGHHRRYEEPVRYERGYREPAYRGYDSRYEPRYESRYEPRYERREYREAGYDRYYYR